MMFDSEISLGQVVRWEWRTRVPWCAVLRMERVDAVSRSAFEMLMSPGRLLLPGLMVWRSSLNMKVLVHTSPRRAKLGTMFDAPVGAEHARHVTV
jgi:hypothetical protein